MTNGNHEHIRGPEPMPEDHDNAGQPCPFCGDTVEVGESKFDIDGNTGSEKITRSLHEMCKDAYLV